VYVNSAGAYGVAAHTEETYGFYTHDKIYTVGGYVGCTSMLIAQNGGDEPLELGALVAIAGLAEPLHADAKRPTLIVRKAQTASSQGIIGVMEGRCMSRLADGGEPVARPEGGLDADRPSDRAVEIITEEPAAPGDYLIVVYRGLVRTKVDALDSAIRLGDLLSISSTPGQAMKAQPPTIEGQAAPAGHLLGTIIGKALEPLDAGQDLIWVLVDLQ